MISILASALLPVNTQKEDNGYLWWFILPNRHTLKQHTYLLTHSSRSKSTPRRYGANNYYINVKAIQHIFESFHRKALPLQSQLSKTSTPWSLRVKRFGKHSSKENERIWGFYFSRNFYTLYESIDTHFQKTNIICSLSWKWLSTKLHF